MGQPIARLAAFLGTAAGMVSRIALGMASCFGPSIGKVAGSSPPAADVLRQHFAIRIAIEEQQECGRNFTTFLQFRLLPAGKTREIVPDPDKFILSAPSPLSCFDQLIC